MRSTGLAVAVVVALVIASTTALLAGSVPIAVSPGSARSASPVDTGCPTFSWGTVDGSVAYEIIVYEIDARGELAPGKTPALRKTLAGSASSWTPSSDLALTTGRTYAWSVRAISDTDPSAWSQPSIFRVSSSPSRSDIEAALAFLRGQARVDGPQTNEGGATETRAAGADADGASGGRAEEDPVPNGIGASDFSIDASGNVEGMSFAGDGSGLTGLDWGNLDNVPGGFADGTDNEGVAYAAGNQLTLDATTFNVTEGSSSGLDADFLDGHDSAYFAAQSTTYSKTEVDGLLDVDFIAAPTPAAPTHLRVGPDYRFPGMRCLAWNMSSLSGVASFIVYQADIPISDGNKDTARRQVASSLSAPVDLFPGSGVQHFRVAAQNVLGHEGPLSAELTIDTTPRIAYAADQVTEDIDELYVAPASGGTAIRVSDPLVPTDYIGDVAWSPDGSKLAYVPAQYGEDLRELYVVPAGGGGATKVNDTLNAGGSVAGFRWSPDGSSLAYTAYQDAGRVYELYVVPAAGGGATKVNDTLVEGGDAGSGIWSPDGSMLAYRADQETDDVWELYVVPATGGGATKVNDTLAVDRDVSSFAWSPDGSRLAYMADQDTDGVNELYVVPSGGGGATKVSDTLVAGRTVRGFAWSPDGSRLAYLADQDTDDVDELYVVASTGGGAIRVNDSLDAGDLVFMFEWSPDGSRLAYVAASPFPTDVEGKVYAVPATGGGAIELSPEMALWIFGGISWSPDGSQLAYRAAETPLTAGEERMTYVVPASGGTATKVADTDSEDHWWSPEGTRIAYDGRYGSPEQVYVAPATGGGYIQISDAIDSVDYIRWSPLGVE